MFTSTQEVADFISEQNIELVDVRFCDVPGVQQHFTIPVSEFLDAALSDGLMFDGSSVRGFTAIHESDMKLIPDISSAFVDPFRDRKTLVVNFSIVDPFTDEPFSRDPRQVAAKAEAYLRSTGIADECFIGAEAEFYLFDDVRYQVTPHNTFFSVDSPEAYWNTGRVEEGGNMGYKVAVKGGYFPVSPADKYADVRDEMSRLLEEVGLTIERAHHEVGSGMHTHISLWKNGEPLFYDERGYGSLSDTARWFIGGLLEHAPALLAFTNPSVNSFRRLVPGFEAPINLVYSARNRSACIRIPVTGTSPKAKRVEYRVPDPSANPYLAFSACLMAGIDGIKRRIEPAAPIDKDLYELPPAEYQDIAKLPSSLEAALDALREDHEFLTEGDVFTQDLIDTWLEYKETNEVAPMRAYPHPYEYQMYYDL